MKLRGRTDIKTTLRNLCVSYWELLHILSPPDNLKFQNMNNPENKSWINETRNQENMQTTIFFIPSLLGACLKMRNSENGKEFRVFTS